MSKKSIVLDKNCLFPTRFMELCSTEDKSLQCWGDDFGVTRQTISNWQLGESVPDIVKLTEIAKYFNVSTDYLLGISDTKSLDVTARAAVEYTGLSESAVEKLNIGIVDSKAYGARLNPQKKNDYSRIASEFICSNEFSEIIHRLANAEKCAHKEGLLRNLNDDRYTALTTNYEGDSVFAGAEAGLLIRTVFNFISNAQSNLDGASYRTNKFDEYSDKKTKQVIGRKLSSETDNSELHQFHVAKAFSRFVDNVISRSKANGNESFQRIQTELNQQQ